MKKPFRTDKAIAVLTYLLDLSNGKNDKYWLNKVMYYIERESILRYGEPVFYDELYSMPLGPVASSVNDGIDSSEQYKTINTLWKEHVCLKESEGNHDVFLVLPGDYSLLSESETDLIEEAYNKFKDFNFFEIMNYFHKEIPEYEETKWNDPQRRKLITYKTLLTKNGYTDKDAEEVISEIVYSGKMMSEVYG
jgi:hypothetical protein